MRTVQFSQYFGGVLLRKRGEMHTQSPVTSVNVEEQLVQAVAEVQVKQ